MRGRSSVGVFLAFSTILTVGSAHSQHYWQQTNGPIGGTAVALEATGEDVIFARCVGGAVLCS
jgi:hypothetical protein